MPCRRVSPTFSKCPVFVRGPLLMNMMSSVFAVRNTDDGIDIDSPGATVTGNDADRNGDLGIDAVIGVLDGGANAGSGNANPLQCVNVSCR